MFQIPNVGSHIRVTTRWRNHYYLTAESQPFVDFTHEGVVTPPEKWDQPFTFNMTGDSKFPIRNISLDHVVNMEIIKGGSKLVKSSPIRIFKVESGKHIYTVTKNNTKYSCTCVGFQYHKNCKHVKGVHQKISA